MESLRDDVPAELVAVVTKMTAKDPEKRFQTPGEVAEALESLASETQPTESTKPEPPVKPGRRKSRFLPLTVIAALFFGIACAATVFYVLTDHGTVRVEVMDPSLAVRFNDQTIRVEDGDQEFTIGADEQQRLVVTLDGSDWKLVTESFEIRRGQEIVFKVEMLKGEILVRKDDDPFDRAPLLVGEWRGTSGRGGQGGSPVTFNLNGTFEMEIVAPAEAATGRDARYGDVHDRFFCSVRPISIWTLSSIQRRSLADWGQRRVSQEAATRGEGAGTSANRRSTSFKTIIEVIDANTLRMAEPDEDSRPKGVRRYIPWSCAGR